MPNELWSIWTYFLTNSIKFMKLIYIFNNLWLALLIKDNKVWLSADKSEESIDPYCE